MNEINVIRRELRALGITRRCRCYGRIVMAIQLAVDQEDSLEAVTKEIFWEVGSRCGRKWDRGGAEHPHCGADRVADQPGTAAGDGGYPLDGPPTASEFLEILSNDVQRARERREEGVSSTPEYDRKRGRKPARALAPEREKRYNGGDPCEKRGTSMYIADLHIHSRFSRATSRDCDLPHLDCGPGAKASS